MVPWGLPASVEHRTAPCSLHRFFVFIAQPLWFRNLRVASRCPQLPRPSQATLRVSAKAGVPRRLDWGLAPAIGGARAVEGTHGWGPGASDAGLFVLSH